jgi:hypothetical protein
MEEDCLASICDLYPFHFDPKGVSAVVSWRPDQILNFGHVPACIFDDYKISITEEKIMVWCETPAENASQKKM